MLVNDNDESRKIVDYCFSRMKTTVNPIIEWTDEEVLEFIRAEKIPYCGLYDCGFKRLGCIGCPIAGKHREKEFLRYPKYKAAYMRSFEKMLAVRSERGMKRTWLSAKDVFNWWMEYDVLNGQIDIFEMIEEAEDYYW